MADITLTILAVGYFEARAPAEIGRVGPGPPGRRNFLIVTIQTGRNGQISDLTPIFDENTS